MAFRAYHSVNEQNAVYCLARHYVAMHKQDFCNETASFFEACAGRKITNQCIGSRESDAGSKQLEACSVQMGISLNSLMVQLLWRWVQEQKEKEART